MADLSAALERIAKRLDLPVDLAEAAILEYEAVGEWLGAEGSPLREYTPEIYPQGSFRLGTTVQPLRKGGEFDIDLVCRLFRPKERTTQKELKNGVGDRLRASTELAKILEERRRCWTLSYAGKFHLDVLPCIPDPEGDDTSILLTDQELTRWQHSNPIGYSEWFFRQMGTVLSEELSMIAKGEDVDVEEVPTWRVRTPLQRVVQLLKRHRDLYFSNDDDNLPVSIIITTLAAHAYRHERDTYSALLGIVKYMPNYIEKRNGEWWVANPAHPDENFADKWNEKPERRAVFLKWLSAVNESVSSALNGRVGKSTDQLLEEAFGSGRARPSVSLAEAPAISDYGHLAALKWPLELKSRCWVKGWVYSKIRNGKKLWQLTDRALPKGIGLKFQAYTNTTPPYEIHWQVVNTGNEAKVAGDLRGQLVKDMDPQSVRWETTKYAGTHWVEAFVVKNGTCVARSGRKYVRVR
jgi:hypothetical protein